jgi:tetratricopeptide (TPR) repeat protein
LLAEADAAGLLTPDGLGQLAHVAYGVGRFDVTIDAWERAYIQSLKAGDRAAAAQAAIQVALHLLFDTALLAPIRGWIGRAELLLEGQEEGAVSAWVAVAHTYERLLSGDFEADRRWSKRAIQLGERHAPEAAAMGRIAEARSLILEGDVEAGLALLDEAAVAAVSGELDPLVIGIVYCEVVCGLQALGQYDRAEQWSVAMERWHPGKHVGSMHGRCRVHRAEILRLRGACSEAEREVLEACDELRPYLRRELGWPLTELGLVRLRLGDLDGAEEAFLAAHAAGWDPQPGLALVRLERGDLALASASISHALEHPAKVPSKEWPPNTDLRRAPLLGAEVEIALAAGDIASARDAASELDRIAQRFKSKALAAAAAQAEAQVRLAMGNTAAALAHFDEALLLWGELGAPYEAAEARLGLGRTHRARGGEQQALLEFRSAAATFEGMGAKLKAALAKRLTREGRSGQPLEPAVPAAPLVRGVLTREGDVWSISFADRTIRVRDAKGFRYLSLLLADPGREFHALDLVARAGNFQSGLVQAESFTAEPLDHQAKEAYRRRLVEIDEDLAEARALNDIERASQGEAERDFLLRELASAVGLGGRARRTGSPAERARVSVTRALRQAMAKVGSHHPELGQHLNHAVRTGTFCAYCPDLLAPIAWTS